MTVYDIMQDIEGKKEQKAELDREIEKLREEMRSICSHPKEVLARDFMNDKDYDEPGKVAHRWTRCKCQLCGEQWDEDVREV